MKNYSKSYLEYREKQNQELLGFRSEKEKIIISILLVGLSFLMFLK